MPLIVMCGFPSSGKTRRAHEIRDYFEKNTDRKVHVVGDATMGIEKNTVYAGKTRNTYTHEHIVEVYHLNGRVCYRMPKRKECEGFSES